MAEVVGLGAVLLGIFFLARTDETADHRDAVLDVDHVT